MAILGSKVDKIYEILDLNKNKFECFVANDNSEGQTVVSGNNKDLDFFSQELKKEGIKNIKLPVSAPFHCKLMNHATEIMKKEIMNSNFISPNNSIISNVTAKPTQDPAEIKNLLIKQIEKPVRWRESVINMINSKVENFIEIGPGKVLSGIVKRIDRNVTINQVNGIEDISILSK